MIIEPKASASFLGHNHARKKPNTKNDLLLIAFHQTLINESQNAMQK